MISRCILRRAGVVGVVTLALSVGATDGVKASSIISNNFGPGDSYSTSGGHVIGVFGPGAPLFSWGEPFTPAGVSYTLDTIAIAATYFFSGPNAMDVSLTSDANGLPGSAIETWHLSNLPPANTLNPPAVLVSDVHPLLQEGTQYWVVASASISSSMSWNFNSTGDVGPDAVSQNGGPFALTTGTRGTFRVTGAVVPEPPSAVMGATAGIMGLGYWWCRRRRAVA